MQYLIKKNYTEEVLDDDGNVVTPKTFINYTVASKTNAKHKPKKGEYFFVPAAPGIENPTVLVVGDSITVIENDDLKEVKDKYKQIDKDILKDAKKVFKTNNVTSMLAFANSYMLRIIAPELYLLAGLKATENTPSFSIGDDLDTIVKIKGFYSEVLFDLDAKRNAKILEYLTLKASKGL